MSYKDEDWSIMDSDWLRRSARGWMRIGLFAGTYAVVCVVLGVKVVLSGSAFGLLGFAFAGFGGFIAHDCFHSRTLGLEGLRKREASNA